jgi:hypothetical protein
MTIEIIVQRTVNASYANQYQTYIETSSQIIYTWTNYHRSWFSLFCRRTILFIKYKSNHKFRYICRDVHIGLGTDDITTYTVLNSKKLIFFERGRSRFDRSFLLVKMSNVMYVTMETM